eukprot:SM000034S12801  [mRNA]  locus=s34:876991:878246:+ [translate_table: standard]
MCYVRRNRRADTYTLYLGPQPDGGKLLAARKSGWRPCSTNYAISADPRCFAGCGDAGPVLGRLRANFLSTKFTVFDNAANVRGGSGTGSTPPAAGSAPILSSGKAASGGGGGNGGGVTVAVDYSPKQVATGAAAGDGHGFHRRQLPGQEHRDRRGRRHWGPSRRRDVGLLLLDESQQHNWFTIPGCSGRLLPCWHLNFRGRLTLGSVKNFQLVSGAICDSAVAGGGSSVTGAAAAPPSSSSYKPVLLEFRKIGKDTFTMDYCYPLSAFQAFAICLSSFGTKVGD